MSKVHKSNRKVNESILLFLKATWIGFGIFAIGGLFIYFGSENHFIRDLGIALVPVGLIALVYEIFLRRNFLTEMRNEFSEAFYFHFESFDQITKAGLVRIHKTFPTNNVAEAFSTTNKIRILQTWIPDVVSLFGHLERNREKLKENINFEIKILMLELDSEFAKVRSKELGFSEQSVSKQIDICLDWLARFAKKAIQL